MRAEKQEFRKLNGTERMPEIFHSLIQRGHQTIHPPADALSRDCRNLYGKIVLFLAVGYRQNLLSYYQIIPPRPVGEDCRIKQLTAPCAFPCIERPYVIIVLFREHEASAFRTLHDDPSRLEFNKS